MLAKKRKPNISPMERFNRWITTFTAMLGRIIERLFIVSISSAALIDVVLLLKANVVHLELMLRHMA